jgi:hypothetical protein
MSETLRKKALKSLQLLARIAAADDNGYAECVSCGVVHHYKDMDGGHFLPKGRSSYWALEVENVHPQCKGCNIYGMKYGSAAQNYTVWMQEYYGKDFVDEMLRDQKKVRKISAAEYKKMTAEWNALIRDHERRICL